MFYGFSKQSWHISLNLNVIGLDHIVFNIVYQITLLVVIDKFDQNLILVNVNNLKLYWYVEFVIQFTPTLVLHLFIKVDS
jgi:hypothetical protein